MAATFALVALRAFQQKNVVGGHFVAAAMTSYLMAAADIGVVLSVVKYGWDAVPWIGTGGAVGVTTAMYLHGRIFKHASVREVPRVKNSQA